LVICKPQIRRAAQVGDWIVGTGPAKSPIGDIRGMMIYAMQVTGKMSMREYDAWAQRHLPEKVPSNRSGDPRRRVGMPCGISAQSQRGHDPDRYTASTNETEISGGSTPSCPSTSITSATTPLPCQTTCRGWSSAPRDIVQG